ncbi:hypothetical protein FRC04_002268 [Tulasnella sp. 424]|nr:hypothetical protein FRC04_002268 [Tulasnella sp. 424]KAG8977342.1 hypothetical protein FRC05_001740 [Tulasnella sp. 425]
MFSSRQQQRNEAPVIRRAFRGDMAPPPDPPLMPPPLAPASSYHTANTHAPTEADEATQRSTQEEDGNPGKPAEPSDPFEGLWGKLVPCNSAMETIDLRMEKPLYSVGRSPDANIPISHPKISSRHCELRLVYNANNTTTVTVVDFSTNGTYVNGVRLGRGRHSMLNHGDELSLGVPVGLTNDEDFRFIFRSRITAIERGGGIHAQYSFGDTLGNGSFATVRRAICKCTGQHYAVKIIAKSKLVNNPKTLLMLDRELSILRDLKHFNITKIKEYYQDESTLFIVMELVEGGDLLDRIIHSGGHGIPEEQARAWTAEMVDAIQYTHRKKIMHRDLKPENVLLTAATPEHPHGRVKVADFGLAKSMADGTCAKTMCGTPAYLAPEVVLNGSQPYDFKVDCWSLGVIVWAMITNTACFPEDENLSLIEKFQNRVVDWQILENRGLSDDCIDFMQRMIVNDSRERMSIVDARNHPWLRGIRNDPPADWTASQSQPSQYASAYGQSESEIYTTEYRGRTPAFEPGSRKPTPRVSAENLRHAEEEITTPMETEEVVRNGVTGYRGFDGSGVSSDAGSRYDEHGPQAGRSAEPMGESKFSLDSESAGSADPFSELRASQKRMEDLKIEDANGDADTAYGGGEDENDGSFVHTSVGTPPHLKKEEMEVDGSSWENVQAPSVERISPPNGAATTNGTRRASGRGKLVRRDVTPTRAGAPVPPTTQKRKAAAANFDGDSSDLSSPPPDDEEAIAARPAAKTPRTSANGRGGATRSTKKSSADAVPASKTPAGRKAASRKSGRGYRAPSDSEDEDEGRPGPSTARKAASPATSAPRRSTRNAQPPPSKAPRLR